MPVAEPLVSIVIITYDRVEDAIAAIESARSQAYPRLEVVVIANVPGGSYEPLADRYRDVDAVSIHEEHERGGVSRARNRGFDHATGDIVVILDDDAVFEDQRAIERIADTFEEFPDVGALSFRSTDYADGSDIPTEIPRGPNGTVPDSAYYTTYFVGVGAAFRRQALDAVSGFPPEFFYYKEELDLSFQLLKAGYELRYVPEVVVRHKGTEGVVRARTTGGGSHWKTEFGCRSATCRGDTS
ncbi:glycosyltransferase [Haloarculaceae archaeon H-GB11]|nr:glycosyltransferase [Haloarculaceae archaeon H-GB11]